MIRVLIGDGHDVVRIGLRSILESHSHFEVVAEAADGKEAILKAIETKPDIAVIDYSMPLMNGIEATRQIRAGFRAFDRFDPSRAARRHPRESTKARLSSRERSDPFP